MRPKKIVLPCPECDAQIEVKSSLTLKQKKAVKELASGKHDTQRAVAKAVDVHENHVSKWMNDVEFNVALVRAENQHLDKARHREAKLAELDAASLDRLLEAARDLPDVELAGNIAKLVSDLRLADAKLKLQLGGDVDGDAPATASSDPVWCDQVQSAYMRGIEDCVEHGRDKALELADTIPAKIEGDAIRSGVVL